MEFESVIFIPERLIPILENRRPPGEEHRKSILQAEDVASVILHLFQLPERVHVPELVVKPTLQSFV